MVSSYRVGMDEQRLIRLIEVGRGVVAELDLDTLLERILQAAREVTAARYAALGILDDRHQELERFLTTGIDPETQATIGDLPRGRGVLGVLISEPRPLRLSDVGAHPRSYGFPVGHPPMRSFLGAPVVVDGEVWGNLYLTEKQGGGAFDEQDEEAIVVLADWAAVAIRNARHHRAVRARRDELERAVGGFEATIEIARALGGETELGRIHELIVKRGRALASARGMVLALAEGRELVVTTVAGEVPSSVVGFRFPLEGSVGGHVLGTGRPERLADFRGRLGSFLADHVEAASGLIVPLRFRDRALGILAAFDRLQDGPEFTAEDERLMFGFAASAATAVATAQSAADETLRRTLQASEAERRRWARELHDATLQDLGGLRIELSSARRSDDPERVAAAVDEAVDHLARATADLRALITDLRPAALDELGIEAALDALAERIRSQADLRVGFSVALAREAGGVPTRHAPELESTVYRLIQEALTNVVKHANASSVDVAVVEHDGWIELTVVDDGVGFSPRERHEGFGLLGMSERAQLAGGTLEVTSAPGDGTTVRARLAAARPGAEEPEATVTGLRRSRG
jgi:signal transduction histidine kinase